MYRIFPQNFRCGCSGLKIIIFRYLASSNRDQLIAQVVVVLRKSFEINLLKKTLPANPFRSTSEGGNCSSTGSRPMCVLIWATTLVGRHSNNHCHFFYGSLLFKMKYNVFWYYSNDILQTSLLPRIWVCGDHRRLCRRKATVINLGDTEAKKAACSQKTRPSRVDKFLKKIVLLREGQ